MKYISILKDYLSGSWFGDEKTAECKLERSNVTMKQQKLAIPSPSQHFNEILPILTQDCPPNSISMQTLHINLTWLHLTTAQGVVLGLLVVHKESLAPQFRKLNEAEFTSQVGALVIQ